MLAALSSSTTSFIVTPTFSLPVMLRASVLMSAAEDEAKAAWLVRAPAERLANPTLPCFTCPSIPLARARTLTPCVCPPHSSSQAKLDAPAWGQAAQAMITVVEEASEFQKLNEECDAGDSAACDTLSKEDEAKAAWLVSAQYISKSTPFPLSYFASQA